MNYFRFEKDKKTENNIIKDVRKKKNDDIQDKIIEGIRNEEQDYYKQVRVDNYWNNSYTQYENNHGRNKNPIIQRIPR